MSFPLSTNEVAGLKSIELLKIFETDGEREFDDLTRLAAQICKVPIAAISLVDADRPRFVSNVGIEFSEILRNSDFCQRAIQADELLIVPDASKDERFAENPLVTGDAKIRFYAAAPLIDGDGNAFGWLCVFDRVPRRPCRSQKDALLALARQTTNLLNLSQRAGELAAAKEKLKSEIAERAKIEKILRLRDQSIASVSEGILITEIQADDNVIVYSNDSFERITGYSFDEIRGRNCRFLQGEKTNPATVDQMRNALAERKFCAVEILNYRKDGTIFWNALSISPIKDENGKVTHFVGVQQDITGRKQVEENLQSSEENYRFLSESVPQHVWTAFPNGKINYGNQRSKDYFGQKTLTEMYNGQWTNVLHPDELAYVIGLWTHAVETGEQYEGEYRLRRWDGEYRWHLAQAIPMFDDKGRIIKWFGSNTDIHDRKTSENIARESAEYRNLFQNANDAIIIFESETETVIDVNEKACRMYDIERDKFIGKSIKDMSLDAERGKVHLQQLFNDGTHQSFETVQFRADGKPLFLLINSSMIEYQGRKVVLSINRDISEEKRIQDELEDSQKRYQLLFDSNPHPIWVYDLETLTFLAVNDIAITRYGYSREEFLNLTIKDLKPAEDIPYLFEQIEYVQLIETPVTLTGRHRKKDETIIDVEVASQAITFGGRRARLVIATDITTRKQAEEQLRQNALHDALTGLPNRALFLEHLRRAIERGRKTFAVLFLDFDHFKIINDSLGHMEGDNLLRLIAQRLSDCLRPGDIVARLGGDEFTILLDDLGKSGEVEQIVERIQTYLKSPFNLNGSEVYTSASIGIALNDGKYTKPEIMLRDADIAMYRAKANGKARHQMFDPTMHERANHRLQLETELRQAIKNEEFCIYYQPIINLHTDRIIGFESLVRWNHPMRGLVSPLEFIPVAEETGLIIQLGEWILRRSCRQLRQWQNEHKSNSPLTMSVNLSCKQFVQKDLVERVVEILRETKIEPETLRLEITESYLMEDSETAIGVMKRLRAAGIKLSIDDFGTGYSSLSYLHRLPINYLKVDRSFVSQMQINSENREIVRTIVSLAKNLNLQVIAEGIETIEQADFLKKLHCDYGQGFLYSKPVAAGQAAELMTDNFSTDVTAKTAANFTFDLVNEITH